MKLGSLYKISSAALKPARNVKQSAKPHAVSSVREEVLARRKKQKNNFSLINIIKTNLENKINEKIVDLLGIRF